MNFKLHQQICSEKRVFVLLMLLMCIRSHLKQSVLFWATTMHSFPQQIFMECLLCAKHISSMPRAWILNRLRFESQFWHLQCDLSGQDRFCLRNKQSQNIRGLPHPDFVSHLYCMPLMWLYSAWSSLQDPGCLHAQHCWFHGRDRKHGESCTDS